MIELQIPGSFKCADMIHYIKSQEIPCVIEYKIDFKIKRFIYDGVVLHHYATYYFTFFNASDAVLCKLIYL